MRRAAKIDANQPDVVQALRQIGCFVQSLAPVGDGCPDLLVGFRGHTLLMEVKDGSRPPSERRLTPDQLEWHARWRGGPLSIVNDVEGAIRAATILQRMDIEDEMALTGLLTGLLRSLANAPYLRDVDELPPNVEVNFFTNLLALERMVKVLKRLTEMPKEAV